MGGLGSFQPSSGGPTCEAYLNIDSQSLRDGKETGRSRALGRARFEKQSKKNQSEAREALQGRIGPGGKVRARFVVIARQGRSQSGASRIDPRQLPCHRKIRNSMFSFAFIAPARRKDAVGHRGPDGRGAPRGRAGTAATEPRPRPALPLSRHGRPPQFRRRSVAPLCHGTPGAARPTLCSRNSG